MATRTRSTRLAPAQAQDQTQMQQRARPTVRDACPGCWRDRVTVVGVDLGEGDKVELHSCDFCERRTWMRNGEVVPMGEVLDTLLRTGGRRPKANRR